MLVLCACVSAWIDMIIIIICNVFQSWSFWAYLYKYIFKAIAKKREKSVICIQSNRSCKLINSMRCLFPTKLMSSRSFVQHNEWNCTIMSIHLSIERNRTHIPNGNQKISIKSTTHTVCAIVTHETVFQTRATEQTRCWNVFLLLVCFYLVIDPVGIETSFRFFQYVFLFFQMFWFFFFSMHTFQYSFQFSVWSEDRFRYWAHFYMRPEYGNDGMIARRRAFKRVSYISGAGMLNAPCDVNVIWFTFVSFPSSNDEIKSLIICLLYR